MAARRTYPDELRERAVAMVFEIRQREGVRHGEIAQVSRQAIETLKAAVVGNWPWTDARQDLRLRHRARACLGGTA